MKMIASNRTKACSYINLAVLLPFLAPALAPAQVPSGPASQLITQAVNSGQLITFSGSTHPLARPEYDRGPAPSSLPMQRMMLVLKRSPEQQNALNQLLAQQQDKTSPNYHHWLTPEQFGQQFGLSDADLSAITAWLQSSGFQIDEVSKGRTFIEFSGTAAQVQSALHTPIHSFLVNGEQHWANASDPQIPAALAPAVAGLMSLHNFVSKPQVFKGQSIEAAVRPGSPTPQFTSGGAYMLAPADYGTIFNINPLYQAGINGSGTTIAVVGRTDITLQDVVSFRGIFGLPSNAPQIIVNGPDPGNVGGSEEVEAVLDTTWSGAIAPNAHVDLVVSESTNTTAAEQHLE